MALQDSWLKLSDAVRWRRSSIANSLERRLRPSGHDWVRHVMDERTAEFVRGLNVAQLDAIEISGDKWKAFGFRSYRSAGFETFDICERPLELAAFDLVIIEQVLEHVLWPFRAARHLYQMLRPGGVLVVTTPFLVKVHDRPVDCSRWTELGLKHLLAEGGFPLEAIKTGSWGNRICARSSERRVPRYVSWLHSLRNEPDYPMVVWAFAERPSLTSERQ